MPRSLLHSSVRFRKSMFFIDFYRFKSFSYKIDENNGFSFFLEERFNDKKKALLEKELVLEEVTTLSEKLRAQVIAAFICAVP